MIRAVKNLAMFGLFVNRQFMECGEMIDLIDKALDYAKKNEGLSYSIAGMCFANNGKEAEIKMGPEVLSYTNISGIIYILNQL